MGCCDFSSWIYCTEHRMQWFLFLNWLDWAMGAVIFSFWLIVRNKGCSGFPSLIYSTEHMVQRFSSWIYCTEHGVQWFSFSNSLWFYSWNYCTGHRVQWFFFLNLLYLTSNIIIIKLSFSRNCVLSKNKKVTFWKWFHK